MRGTIRYKMKAEEIKELIAEMIDTNNRTDTLIFGNELLKKLERKV